jgi:hypothetical protein
MVVEQLKQNIIKAFFIDKVQYLTEVSLMYSSLPYAVGNINKQDICNTVSFINSSGLFVPIVITVNGYGVLTLSL